MTTENRTYLWKSGGGLPYLPGVGMVIIDSAVRSRFAPLGSMRASPRLSEWGHHHEHMSFRSHWRASSSRKRWPTAIPAYQGLLDHANGVGDGVN